MWPRLPDWLSRRAASRAPQTKASRAAKLVALFADRRPVWTPRDYASLAEEGYRRNPIVFRCVRLIAEAAATAVPILHAGNRELRDHPVLALLAEPNPRQVGTTLLEDLYGHLLVSGNAYLEAVAIDGLPRELYALRPDRMRLVPGSDGWPEAYDYTVGGRTIRFRQDGEALAPVLHLKFFDPINDHYGLSPIEAAAAALDVHNAAGTWNKALLDNAARPSGALVYGGDANLSETQFARLKEELEATFQGARNAGRPLLLEGGLDWKPLSLSPKELDFIAAKSAAAREIAAAFGVPPMLLGIPGDATYANYQEASRAFWRSTVVPLAARTLASIVAWLAPAYGPVPRLEIDLDRIEALGPEREALWRRVTAADFLTVDEKRQAIGYGILPPGASIEVIGNKSLTM
jgi:HK97 family phage portal protein